MQEEKIYSMSFGNVYPHYVAKAERNSRSKQEVDQIICWLTGYSKNQLNQQISSQVSFRDFFDKAPEMNPVRILVEGVVCGIRVEEISQPLMREIRI